MFNMFLGFG
jgi:MFS family permease